MSASVTGGGHPRPQGAEPNVLVLGPLRVVAADGTRSVTGHAGRLLIELIVGGPIVSRERLADALWGDEPPSSADAALRMHLTRLRRLLEGTDVAVERSGPSLELLGARTDLDECARCVADARELRATPATWDALDRAAATLEVVTERWRGQPFAPYDDDPTLASSVQRVQSLRAEAEELAFDVALARGRHRAAIPDLERAIAEEPFREGAWARLMVALYREGRQRDALAAYSSARALLVEQLGVEPGPELQRRYAQVLAQDPELDWVPPVEPDPGPPILTGIRSDRSDALIGRDKQFDAVVTALGEHRLVTVTGPPGIGKSALVRAVSDAAVIEPVVLDLDRVAARDAVTTAVAEALGLHPDPSDGVDPLPLVAAALADSDVIAVLDGGDHLGPSVADVVAELLDSCGSLRLLAARRAPLGLFEEAVVELPLLTPDDGLALLVQLLDSASGPAPLAEETALERVVETTDGHPLSLQLAAGWIQLLGGDVVAARLASQELPIATDPTEPFVERVDVSLRSVDDRARDAFVHLAPFCNGFDVDAVARVSGLSARDAAAVMRDLRRVGLIQADPLPGRWFLLTAIRDAAWELADRWERRDEVVARHEALLIEVLAPWRSASIGFDAPGVIRALDPWRADLHHLYERRVRAGDLDGLADLVDGLYWYWDASGDRTVAARLLEQALTVGRSYPDHRELGFLRSLHSSIGGTFAWQADHLDEVALALQECERHDHHLGMFSAHLGLAMGHGWRGDLDAAEVHLEAARAFVDDAPRYFAPSIESYLGVVRLAQGDFDGAWCLLEGVVEAYDEMGCPWGAAHALSFLGMVAQFSGDRDRAESVFHLTVERARECGKTHSELHARMGLADLLADAGAEDDAVVEYELVTAELLDLGDLGCAGQTLCGWAEASRSLGELESARWLLAEGATVGRRGRDPGVVHRAVAGLAEVAIERGDLAEAGALLRALEAGPVGGGRPVRGADVDRLARCREALAAAGSAPPLATDPGMNLAAMLAEVRADAQRAGVVRPVTLGGRPGQMRA